MPSQRVRTAAACVLLAAAAVFIAVALSQWLLDFTVVPDPRDDALRRAAGMGFTDEARGTLFSIVPVAAPALAAWLPGPGDSGRVIRRLARIFYAALIVIGLLLALSAARYGLDQDAQLAHEGRVFIDTRAVVERLLLDLTWLVLAGLAWWSVRWSAKRE